MSEVLYDPARVRELAIESLGDQFVDMYIMEVPGFGLRKIFIKTKDELSWEEVRIEGMNKISPYFHELYGHGVQVHLTQGLKGGVVYVKDGVSSEQELHG
ncbi:MAG: hypothetical protein FWG65_01300 [Turicibacter sp.]|nr:hypothetical protein [Turicibacter sp.]